MKINLYHNCIEATSDKQHYQEKYCLNPNRLNANISRWLLKRKFAWNIKKNPEKNKKNISKCHLLNFLPSILSVKGEKHAL